MKNIVEFKLFFIAVLAAYTAVVGNVQPSSAQGKSGTILGRPANEVGDFLRKDDVPTVIRTLHINGKLVTEGMSIWSSEKDSVWKTYCAEAGKKIAQNWVPSRQDRSSRVVIKFGILKNGSLGSVRTIGVSDYKLADEQATQAVKESAPFPKWPTIPEDNKFEPEIVLAYNIFDKSAKKSRVHAWANETDPIWNSYMTAISKQIGQSWVPLKEGHPYVVVVKFNILKNGSLGAVQVTKSSGSKMADQLAIEDIKEAAPFPKWPATPKDNKVEAEMEFTYNCKSDSK